MQVKEMDKKFLSRDLPPDDIEIVKSDGNFLFDSKGKKYIDFLMGWCVGNVGWGNEEIKKKIKKYNGPDYVNPNYLYKSWAELAELLAKITPGKLKKSFRATGGTEAVEIALQAAMSHTKRHKFISIEGSYHGHSIGAMSVGSSDFRNWYKNLLPDCYKIKPPLDDKAADEVEKLLKQKDIAALIMEPIICNLGVIIPEKEFMTRAQSSCKKYGTLLIMDEVATGFERTGKLFASEYFDLEPDIMCLAKGITGGYGGLGATITTEEIAKSMEYEFSFYSTYGWHPLSAEIAIANIKYILKHKKQLEKNINEMSKYFTERLSKMKFKYPANVHVKGLAIGVEFKKPNYANQIVAQSQKNGVLFSSLGNTIFTLFPALNIDRKTAEKGLNILEKSLML
ncbi:MAG: aspartate aminotransferase family protein [Patescibacteria group bacterium]|nr:aspartate aminotransferase family protein [Patescibacteria group bacterium]MDD5164005.1 aspartate aminotransferase family protein [Patescibacteria group bacterium]MDD5534911.1 aspartate aminotransferase family protein [Patescibacteria group bacterium]